MSTFTLNPNIYIIDTPELFQRLVDFTNKINTEYFIYDTETNGLIIKKLQLFGIGICFNSKNSFYIVWRDDKGNIIWTEEQQNAIKTWFETTAIKSKIICHNAAFDILVIEATLGINLESALYCDTQLLKHTVEEEPPFSLKEIAVAVLGEGADQSQQDLKDNVLAKGGRWTKDEKDMYKADTAILGKYCCFDVVLTYEVFKYYSIKLAEEGLEKFFYEEEVMPLYKEVTINMKRKGFPIDVPHFERLKSEITKEIDILEEAIQKDIEEDVQPFVAQLLDKDYPVKTVGNFPKLVAEHFNIPLPIARKKVTPIKNNNPNSSTTIVMEEIETFVNTPLAEALYTESFTLNKKAIEKQLAVTPEYKWFYEWVLAKDDTKVPVEILRNRYEIQRLGYFKTNPEEKYIFNLNSTDHLAYWLVEVKGYKADKTEKGKWQIDKDFIEEVKSDDISIQKLQDLKRLNKILSTYILGILNRAVDGVLYTDMLQHGTSSGRFSSRNPNLQNLPRVKDDEAGLSQLVLKYVNSIRRGFISGQGRKLVDADYSSLEPVCFAHMSDEQKIRDIFINGKDLYSQVAIDVNKLEGTYSANKKADNFLKKFRPELRQLWKIPTLGIVYGMEESRLVEAIGCNYKEATQIIQDYLTTYPNLKKYMTQCNIEAKTKGYVKTVFGRIRHLPRAKELYQQYGNDLLDRKWAKAKGLLNERYELKNLLNNAKNFKIQGLAGHIINRAMIEIAKELKIRKLDAYIALMVHDQVISIAEDCIAEEVKVIMRDKMQNTTKISVPLIAEPEIATNLAESH